MGSILYIKQCPPRGGDTLFANVYAAYESLSDRMKAYLDGLTALHDGEQTYRRLYANYGVPDRPEYPPRRTSCRAHASGHGREGALLNRGFTRFLIGAPRTRATRCSRISTEDAGNPLFRCPFRWSENAVAFWDNRCAQHRAM